MKLQELGIRIQLAREEKKMSQEQLATAIGCSQSALSNYEKGKRRIYLSQLERLAEVLGKPFDYFLDGMESSNVQTPATGGDNPIIRIITAIHELNESELQELEKVIEFLKWKRAKEGQ